MTGGEGIIALGERADRGIPVLILRPEITELKGIIGPDSENHRLEAEIGDNRADSDGRENREAVFSRLFEKAENQGKHSDGDDEILIAE